jgi:antitoxin CptB
VARAISVATASPTPRSAVSGSNSGAQRLAGIGDGDCGCTADTTKARVYMTLSMTEPVLSALDVRRRRLLYRACHRGSHENDLLVGGYVSRHLASLDESQLDALERLLELPDADLADWLTGRRPIPPGPCAATLETIRAFALGMRDR